MRDEGFPVDGQLLREAKPSACQQMFVFAHYCWKVGKQAMEEDRVDLLAFPMPRRFRLNLRPDDS
jgi:hypothetical protein